MSSPDPKERDFQQREADLRERELALKLKAMEMELDLAKRSHPRKQKPRNLEKRPSRIRRWRRNAIEGIKLFAVVVLVVAAIRVAYWLASIVLVLGVSYLAYKLFFANRFNRDDDYN